jgi:hypothetical protein
VSTPIWLMGCSSLSDSIKGPILNCWKEYFIVIGTSSEVLALLTLLRLKLQFKPFTSFYVSVPSNNKCSKKWAKPFLRFSSLDPT